MPDGKPSSQRRKKAKMAKERDGGRAEGAKGKDTEARAAKDMAAKAKDKAMDKEEAQACMVWI